MEILGALFALGGLFMILDVISPTLRIVAQAICSVVLGVAIAAYIISKTESKTP